MGILGEGEGFLEVGGCVVFGEFLRVGCGKLGGGIFFRFVCVGESGRLCFVWGLRGVVLFFE